MGGTVNLIGLGVMGRPMARNLARAGFDVVSFTRSAASRERARGDGLTVVDALADLPAAPDFVVTVLPDSPDVEAVLFAEDGPVARSADGTLFIDMSTIAPGAARSIGERLGAAGRRFLDAPVSGGESGAIDAVLSIMVGGAADDVDVARPLFEAMGTTVVHVGPQGSGQVTKAANQMIVATNLAVVGEALVFLRGHGIDPAVAMSVIGGGLAGSTVIDRKAAAMIAGDFTPGFRLALHLKDLGFVERAAAEAGLPLEVTALVTQRVRSLVATGHGDLDHGALYLSAAEQAGLPLDS
ncbi:MAG: NAD(P)-binding domain-containing protein [Arachnia sp.]